MRTLTTLVALGALTAGGLVATGPAAHAGPERVARTTATHYALGAFGIGTSVRGGEIPADSGRTAYRIIGCSNLAGVERENHIARATVPGLGDVSAVETRVWTAQNGDITSSHAEHSVGKVVIGRGSDQGTLTINAIQSRAWAYHNDKGFHARYESSIGAIVYRPTDGAPEYYTAPSPGQTLEIPGLAKIKLGSKSKHKDSDGARAYTTALKIEVIPSDTTVRVAHVSARIGGGVKHGLFNGGSNATRASALEGNVTSGPNPHLPMPCEGTGGEVKHNDLAEVDLGGQIVASGLNTSAMGDQSSRRAWGWTRSSIAEVALGGGQLILERIVGVASVEREGRELSRSLDGTTLGSITWEGEPQEIPEPGESLEIPGVAKIETKLVEETRTGVKVTSVRVTLLDGSGAVIDLGQAELSIRRAGF